MLRGSSWTNSSADVLFINIAHFYRPCANNTLLTPRQHFKYSLPLLSITLLCFAYFFFLLAFGCECSQYPIIVFAPLTLGSNPTARLACVLGMRNGFVAGRGALALGEACELEKLAPHDLRSFDLEEVTRIGGRRNNQNKGLGEAGHGQGAGAIDLAQGGGLLRLSPLPVKRIPDSNIGAVPC